MRREHPGVLGRQCKVGVDELGGRRFLADLFVLVGVVVWQVAAERQEWRR